jgi:RNA polymerase sigma factor (sigma-70 family)
VEAAVAQDLETAGLTAVLAEHRQQLIRFFTSRTGDAAEAEDVVQEIWLHVVRMKGGARTKRGPIANPLAYLHRVGMNIVLDRLREGRRRARREQDWSDTATSCAGNEAVDETPSPLAIAEGRARIRALAAAIEKLPPGAAHVFRRHKLDGVGHAQIAAELGISRSAVEKHIAVALRHLREALE